MTWVNLDFFCNIKVLNRYRLKHANRSNKHHLQSFSRTRNYSFKAFQAEPWWESRYADGLYEWDRRDSLLSLFLHLSYLNQILVHVFWYKISSRCTDTSVSKALKGWSQRSPSSPPLHQLSSNSFISNGLQRSIKSHVWQDMYDRLRRVFQSFSLPPILLKIP